MDDQPGLFLDLPAAAPPLYLYADEHVLEPCWRCDGSGQERPPEWWSKTRVALFWDPTCRECRGAGKCLRFVGPVLDVTPEAALVGPLLAFSPNPSSTPIGHKKPRFLGTMGVEEG